MLLIVARLNMNKYYLVRESNNEVKYNPCGRRQVVRHQPSKLIFAGPNPVARSGKPIRYQENAIR